jgi:hypothetical protein
MLYCSEIKSRGNCAILLSDCTVIQPSLQQVSIGTLSYLRVRHLHVFNVFFLNGENVSKNVPLRTDKIISSILGTPKSCFLAVIQFRKLEKFLQSFVFSNPVQATATFLPMCCNILHLRKGSPGFHVVLFFNPIYSRYM